MVRTEIAAEGPRTLSTARSVLKVLRYLLEHVHGVTVAEVSQYLAKSPHTAYYLLNSLCQEGFACRGTDGRYRATAFPPELRDPLTLYLGPSLDDLNEATRELNRVTGCRAYFVVYDRGAVVLAGVHGHRGQPGVRLSADLRQAVHALAVGKAILAHLPNRDVDAYFREVGLKPFTPNTKTDPSQLKSELLRTRVCGLAVDREEYEEGICCLAVPLIADCIERPVVGAMGVAVAKGRFQAEAKRLARALREVVLAVSDKGRFETGKGGGHGWS